MTTDAAVAAEDRRWTALLENDFETLAELTHPSLTYTHSNAIVDTKDSWIGSVVSGAVDYRQVAREDVAAIRSGDTTVITGKATFTVGVRDTEITIIARFTSVWVNEDGQWLFFAWQNTPIPAS